MKQIFYVLILISLMAVSCQKDDSPTIEVDVYAAQVEHEGGSVVVGIVSNTTWEATCDSSKYVTIKPSRGSGSGYVTISVAANKKKETQAFKIVYVAQGEETNATTKTTITQLSAPFISLGSSTLTIPNTGGSRIISVASSGKWKASTQSADVTISPMEGDGCKDVTLTLKSNPDLAGSKLKVLFEMEEDPDKKAELTITVGR